MQKNLNLSIPKPCTEKWENFIPSPVGGFCSSCNKVVVDFTKKGDDEIADFFRSKPAHACGRFRPDQLKLYVLASPPAINPGFALLKAGVLSLLLLMISRPASAQKPLENPKVEVQNKVNQQTERDSTETSYIVKGLVKDEYGDILPGVNVILKGSVYGTVADADGRFEFPVRLKEGDVLIFTFIGLESKEYRIRKQSKNEAEINMEMNIEMDLAFDITGEVAVNEIYSPRQSGLQRFWLKIKEVF